MRRKREVRRRRVVALAAVALIAATTALAATSKSPSRHALRSARHAAGATTAAQTGPSAGSPRRPRAAHAIAHTRLSAEVAVGLRVLTFVDRARTVRFLNGTVEPRALVTEVRYPAVGRAGADDVHNAAPLSRSGPYPLVVFGHGFAVAPDVYAPLLDAWVRAGYVVAAPVFQLGSPYAPGGPNEADLVNWPRDMSFVISSMLNADAASSGPLAGIIERGRIAAAGQSDGGDTALAISFDAPLRDSRVNAAVILSGAEIPMLGSFSFPRHGPPLLATQGSADTINLPSATQTFFSAAPSPKFLLTLVGAPHLPPYTTEQPYLSVIERVTIAFLDHYVKHTAPALARMLAAGSVNGVATIQAHD